MLVMDPLITESFYPHENEAIREWKTQSKRKVMMEKKLLLLKRLQS